MMDAMNQLQAAAEQALQAMRAAGFDQAQVTASRTGLDELSVKDNEPALLRSTANRKLALLGIRDGRMASTELTSFEPGDVRERIAVLFDDAGAAPRDDANAVSAGQRVRLLQGPQAGDRDMLATAMSDLLTYRESSAPRFVLSESEASHHLQQWHTLTSGGSDLAGSVGWYSFSGFGTARDGAQSSSFNYAGGNTNDLRAQAAQDLFGMGQMMRDTSRQITTSPIGDKFTGDVVLMPNAVESLLGWLLGQLGDMQLIAGTSLYNEKVGEAIASPLFSLRGRFDMPGVAAVSADAFATPNVDIIDRGVLRTLTPTLYGSRKTGLKHVPVAGRGWEIAAGDTPLADMVGSVQRGALVGRLSMGSPAANGNFSGVIKNSFAIGGGEVGDALSETMISGNMAQMLRDIVAVSRETLEGDGWRFPWIRIGNLHFS
jgi:PmbA protein